MKTLLISLQIFLYCFLLSITVNAQTWRWGERGGSADGQPGGADETVIDMATDVVGNVYILSNVKQTNLSVDGNTKTAWGGQDIMISSFKCDGTYRWSKVIGGTAEDIPAAIKTDTLGGVYLVGYLGTHYINIHFDSDTTWSTGASYKSLFIAKYDTAGHYKWLRMPEPDSASVSAPANVRALDLDVDAGGNASWLCGLYPGAYAGGSYVVATKGVYVLKYSSSGIFQSGTHLQAGYSSLATGGLLMKVDHGLNRYYITGDAGYVANLSFNNIPVTHSLFMGAFNNAGNLIWQKQNTNVNTSGSLGRVAIDATHNIYVTGTAANTDTFNHYVVVNTLSPYNFGSDVPIVMKLDTNGNSIWAKNASSDGQTYCSMVSLNGSEVAISGAYPGKFKWAAYPDSLNHILNQGYDIFFTHFNGVSGNILGMDTLASSFGDNEFATGITTDRHGNVYVGGSFSGDLRVNTSSLITAGGGSDFFIAKYGYDNCTCTVMPSANFNYSGIHTISFSYTGSVTNLDSVVWNFGDGGHATGNTTTHLYTAPGTYNACVTAYTGCGNDTHCNNILISTSVTNVNALTNVNIYPNPLMDLLYIEHAPIGSTVQVFNMMGQEVYNSTITTDKQQISVGYLSNGSYLLQLTDANDNRKTIKVIKQ